MGNQNSTPAAADNAFTSDLAFNAPRKFALPIEILFEVFAFVKLHEAPNFFLVNRHLLQICQVYFHSGTVGHNKYRNVRNFSIHTEGLLTISVERNGAPHPVPLPEVDPPKIFNAFGIILVEIEKEYQIEAIQFLNKFQSLMIRENNYILICDARTFFLNTPNANGSEKQINSNSSSTVVDEKQYFMNWIAQKKLLLTLSHSYPFNEGIARCLADEPLIAQFNGRLVISFKTERNLCGLEEDAKLIYGWISSGGTRELKIWHHHSKKARELAFKIALLFEEAHVNKIEAEKMDLAILVIKDIVVPMYMKKVCNGIGEQLATLRTISVKSWRGIRSAYIFYTKPLEYRYENKEELELIDYRNSNGVCFNLV